MFKNWQINPKTESIISGKTKITKDEENETSRNKIEFAAKLVGLILFGFLGEFYFFLSAFFKSFIQGEYFGQAIEDVIIPRSMKVINLHLTLASVGVIMGWLIGASIVKVICDDFGYDIVKGPCSRCGKRIIIRLYQGEREGKLCYDCA